MAARQVTATCRDCGLVEKSNYSGPAYRCFACTERVVSRIRRMLDDGMTKGEIAASLGISNSGVTRWIADHGLTLQPRANRTPHGVGKKPADLMPSAEALAAASIWSFALHDRSVFSAANSVTPN
jgi:hypothetical protein